MHSPIITPAQMRAAEEAAFARGITAEALMERAGAGIARAVTRFFPRPGRCIVFAGKGHNAGDAFVAARCLAQAGWRIETRLIFPRRELTALTIRKWRQLHQTKARDQARPPCRTIVLDGLLGLGARPPLREPIRRACQEINSLGKGGVRVFAIDLPTGLDGESGQADTDCVMADFTVTIGCAKTGLIADSALDFVGRLEVVALEELQPKKIGDAELATQETLRRLLPRRKYSSYKNQFGRIGILAGSRGFTGAAVMCSLGALRGGAGLVELFVPEDVYQVVAAAAAPEVMVKAIKSYRGLAKEPIDVWAIGPGLGKAYPVEILRLIRETKQPTVIDADGLNILATSVNTLRKAKGPRLLTPHPGEMKRIFPHGKLSRAEIATRFCEKYAVTLLLKGSRTIVAQAGQPLSYNTTGNPGMATGGMGDVLTGVCAGLFGAKLAPSEVARLAAWVCGRAAELAIFNGNSSEETLLPRDVLDHLGTAFNELRESEVGAE